MRKLLGSAALAAAMMLAPLAAQAEGNLAAPPAERIEITVSGPGPTISANSFELTTGRYYRLTLISDGQAEAMFRSPELLRNSWINQVIIAGIEVHLQGMTFYGVEFDAAGDAAIAFVPIRPGEYPFTIGEATGTFIVR